MASEADMIALIKQAKNILESLDGALQAGASYELDFWYGSGGKATTAICREMECCDEAISLLEGLSVQKSF